MICSALTTALALSAFTSAECTHFPVRATNGPPPSNREGTQARQQGVQEWQSDGMHAAAAPEPVPGLPSSCSRLKNPAHLNPGSAIRVSRVLDASALLLASSAGRWAGVFFLPLLVRASLCPAAGQYCECTGCPHGQYSTAAMSPAACAICPRGTYAASIGQGACDSCPAGQSSGAGAHRCTANADCDGGAATNARSGATGGSSQLSPEQCIAWVRLYDDTRGANWTHCADARTDPCSCKGSNSDWAYTCSSDGTTIQRM